MKISGSRTLITGGSSGIGLETARQLVAGGGRVAICGRDEDKLRRIADEIGAFGIPADVSREDEVENLVSTAIDKLGGLDVLVNNAGYGYGARLVDIDRQKFDRLFATNVTGAMLAARAAARHFLDRNYGNIVNIASTSGLHGGRGSTAYSATKFALRGMTECWRAELRPHNIRVMLVNPSEVLTDFFAAAGRHQEQSEKKLRPEEIAHVILSLLAMDDRGFVTDATVFATNPF